MANRNNYTPDCPQVQAVRNALKGKREGLTEFAIGRITGMRVPLVDCALSYMTDVAEDDKGHIFLVEAKKWEK